MKQVELNVDIHHLTRVEGHGNIRVRVVDGRIEEARWDVVETPRFFEVMLRGKHYTSAGILSARICGICSIGHCLASLRATEDAFGTVVPEPATKLRLLAKHGETLQSHALHLFFLAAPDFLGVPSVIPLVESHPDVVALAARIKGLGNRLAEVIAGRAVHPVSLQVGGVAKMPTRAQLGELQGRLEDAVDDLAAALALFQQFEIPDFQRETEFVSLAGGDDHYFWIGGELLSTDGVRKAEHEYLAMTNEEVVEGNTSKWCHLSRDSFAVGALARFNNNCEGLLPQALEAAGALGLTPVCHNPYHGNTAQLVECVHVVHDSLRLIEELRELRGEQTMATVEPRAGTGFSAVEVPRGILYHCYEYGDDGRIIAADCVIPTTQNNGNIHRDMGALVEHFKDRDGMTDAELSRLCAMLVRAYDPCISCSVH
jgi:coenzyme F420-reducing hydrogenase alpha subunit